MPLIGRANRPRLGSRYEVLAAGVCFALLLTTTVGGTAVAGEEPDNAFYRRPLVAYVIPGGQDNIIGGLQVYTVKKGDTLLDVARWYGLTATEVSNANNHLDWWRPTPGKRIIIPTEHILPPVKYEGLVLNIPERRLYYFPSPVKMGKKARKGVSETAAEPVRLVYTFPVGLGRFDWRTPIGTFKVRSKTKEPTWVIPDSIYAEHVKEDGDTRHVIPGGSPDNPLGHYRLALTLPLYAIHGTNKPWGVGMDVSHGCVRLYPEDIERLFYKVEVGTRGRFVYFPVKYGWRGGQIYVEVHDDVYGRYPGLWRYALDQAKARGLLDKIDLGKLKKAVLEKTGVPTPIGLDDSTASGNDVALRESTLEP